MKPRGGSQLAWGEGGTAGRAPVLLGSGGWFSAGGECSAADRAFRPRNRDPQGGKQVWLLCTYCMQALFKALRIQLGVLGRITWKVLIFFGGGVGEG